MHNFSSTNSTVGFKSKIFNQQSKSSWFFKVSSNCIWYFLKIAALNKKQLGGMHKLDSQFWINSSTKLKEENLGEM